VTVWCEYDDELTMLIMITMWLIVLFVCCIIKSVFVTVAAIPDNVSVSRLKLIVCSLFILVLLIHCQ